jgi:hypothetical protein
VDKQTAEDGIELFPRLDGHGTARGATLSDTDECGRVRP